jgi:hypothetical protein
LLALKSLQQSEKYHQARVSWGHHILMLHHEYQFNSKYNMTYDSFMKLVDILSLLYSRMTKTVSPMRLSVRPLMDFSCRFYNVNQRVSKAHS